MKKFSGCWATFEYLDDFCNAIKEVKSNGFHDITTHSPCPRHEITHALHEKESRVPFFTLCFGLLGTLTAFTLATWMSLDWVLPVSNKPIISIPPFVVIMFELTVLFGSYGTAIGIVALIKKDYAGKTFPVSGNYKVYDRFLDDRFGIVVRCDNSETGKIEGILQKHQPEEIYNEA